MTKQELKILIDTCNTQTDCESCPFFNCHTNDDICAGEAIIVDFFNSNCQNYSPDLNELDLSNKDFNELLEIIRNNQDV